MVDRPDDVEYIASYEKDAENDSRANHQVSIQHVKVRKMLFERSHDDRNGNQEADLVDEEFDCVDEMSGFIELIFVNTDLCCAKSD